MNAFISRWLMLLLQVVFCAGASAFVVRGPFLGYQTSRHGYDGAAVDDRGGPQDLHDEYRWNIPVITYGCDPSFVNYFGTNGLAEVDKAFKLLNDLPPVSQITDQVLSNMYPLVSYAFNGDQDALGGNDIKSWVFGLALQNLGLISAEQFVWGIRNRWTSGSNPGQTNWIVRKWNYDPFTLLPSTSVNGNEYTYLIRDDAILDVSYLFPVPSIYTTAASMPNMLGSSGFVIDFTVDDIGGLRYLYDTNNINVERLPGDVFRSGSQSGSGGSGSPWNTPVFNLTNLLGSNLVVQTPGVSVAKRFGRDKISFVRLNYDYLVGGALLGWTNQFVDRYLTNGVVISQNVARANLVRPDMVFSSGDLGLVNNAPRFALVDVPDFLNNSDISGDQSGGRNGPGVIEDSGIYRFSNVFPYYINNNLGGGDVTGPDGAEPPGGVQFWASFDETSEPVIYPVGHGWTPLMIEQMIRESAPTSASAGN